MNKVAHFYVNYKNMVVLQGYLDVIKEALILNGFECDDITSCEGLDKNDLFVFPMGIDAFKHYWKGYKNYILWQQGATADESFMRNQSKVRYHVLNYIDCFAMKKAKMVFFCSQFMKQHYEKLSHHSFDAQSYLMPCYNETLSTESIDRKDYSKKNFAYVGSLDLWQCFDEIVSLYRLIERVYPEAHLKVLTFSVEEAIKKIKDAGIQNYDVKCVKKEEVQNEIRDCVYGFIIRKESVVNQVATPTKISSYMSVGIIPIFSTVLDDFNRTSKNMKYVIRVNGDKQNDNVLERIGKQINKDELKYEFVQLFETYYGTEYHIKNINEMMRGLL